MQQSYWTPLPAERTYPPPPADYYPWFDWLRAVLAIVVMMGHDGMISWHEASTFAVETFFALSGYLIGGILLKVEPVNLPRFFFNRSIRIWIPYYIALTLLVAVSLLKDPITLKWAEFVGYDLLMVWNLFGTNQLDSLRSAMPLGGTGNHLWSVNSEEQFYLLSPLLLVLAPRWGRSIMLWSILAAASWLSGVYHYPAMIMGVLAAIIGTQWPDFQQKTSLKLGLVAIGLVGAAGLLTGRDYATFAPLGAMAIVLLLAVRGSATPLGTVAGGMSYPLYLNNWIGVFVANAALAPFGMRDTPLRQAVSCLFSLAMAVGLYLYVDRRLLTQRSSWFTEGRGWTVTVCAYVMVCVGVLLGLYLRR